MTMSACYLLSSGSSSGPSSASCGLRMSSHISSRMSLMVIGEERSPGPGGDLQYTQLPCCGASSSFTYNYPSMMVTSSTSSAVASCGEDVHELVMRPIVTPSYRLSHVGTS